MNIVVCGVPLVGHRSRRSDRLRLMAPEAESLAKSRRGRTAPEHRNQDDGDRAQRRIPHESSIPSRPHRECGEAHISTRLSRSAFAITETELKVIAALATIGLSSKPKNG